jgi:hypothetical protein
MVHHTTYICKPDTSAEANEGSIYAMIVDDKATLGNYKGYMIRRRKKFGDEVLQDIFVLPEDFKKYYIPASIIDMSLLHEDAFLDVDLAAVEKLMPTSSAMADSATAATPAGFAETQPQDRTVSGVGKCRSQMEQEELDALDALLSKL